MTRLHQVMGLALLTLAISGVVATAGPSLPKGVPLPEEIVVTRPDPNVNPDYAPFSGTWTGAWGGNKLDHVLVVEKIEGNKAHVIYAWGTYPNWGIFESGWVRRVAEFGGDGLEVKDLGPNHATYNFDKDGTLRGWYRGPRANTTIKLGKIP